MKKYFPVIKFHMWQMEDPVGYVMSVSYYAESDKMAINSLLYDLEESKWCQNIYLYGQWITSWHQIACVRICVSTLWAMVIMLRQMKWHKLMYLYWRRCHELINVLIYHIEQSFGYTLCTMHNASKGLQFLICFII